jgi:hypothetical protein
MLDKEAQQALVALMQTKQNLEDQVLKSMRSPDLTTEQLIKLRKKYLGFLEKLQEVEDELQAHERGTPEEWIAMWKGQKDE